MTGTNEGHVKEAAVHVVPTVPAKLREEVEEFVAAKRALVDGKQKPAGYRYWAASLDPVRFVDGAEIGDFACWPAVTLTTVLPFFNDSNEGQRTPAYVPVSLVIGSSFKWRADSMPNKFFFDTAEEWEAWFTSEDRFVDQPAHVTHLKSLGLFYVSGDGKNRVSFLRERNVEFMPCLLSEASYPEPQRLKLVEVFEGPLRTWLCILDSRWVRNVPYPEITLPILTAYGVERCGWEVDRPRARTVLSCLRAQRPEREVGGTHSVSCDPLDLEKIARQEQAEEDLPEHQWQPIFDSKFMKLEWNRWFRCGVTLGVLALLFGAFELSRPLALLLAGATLGWGGLLFLRVCPIAENPSEAVVAAKVGDQIQ